MTPKYMDEPTATVSIKDINKPHIAVFTNLDRVDSPLEELTQVMLRVSAPYSAIYSHGMGDGETWDMFDISLHRHEGETGHALRLRATKAMDALSAMFVRGRREQRKATLKALGAQPRTAE